MKDKIRKIKENISNAPHKKKAIIAIIVALCLVGGAAGGYSYMTHTDFGKADVASQSDDKELTAEEKEKAAEEELEKAKESGDKEAIEKAEKEVEKAKEKVNASNSNSSSSNSSSHKSNSGTSNKGSYSKPSNSGGSSNNKPSKPSSGNSGSSGSGGSTITQPSKPAHQHNWQPIYDYDYANAYYECRKCHTREEETPEHIKNCGGSWELKYPIIIVGYQCYSCGATK